MKIKRTTAFCIEKKGEEMRLLMIRHGDPDYDHDCLTQLGHKQAAAVAKRLENEGISKIYASPMERAMQTAAYTAQTLGLSVHTLPYMHEISWGGEGIPDHGHPWDLAERMVRENDPGVLSENWYEHDYFSENEVLVYYKTVIEGIDDFLRKQGFMRSGKSYLCTANNTNTIALFSHSGSESCVLAHLLNLPFPYVCTTLPLGFTSVTELRFDATEQNHTMPKLLLFNDMAHTCEREIHIQREPSKNE